MEQLAEKVFLKERHDELAEFFRKTWEEPSETEKYEYRVYLSQMCMNLNELFFIRAMNRVDEKEKERLTKIRGSTFVTSDGLLTQMEKLVDYYEEQRIFPRILVVDLLFTTGESFAEATKAWFNAISAEETLVARKSYATFLMSTDYAVFMRSKDDSSLMTTEYDRRMMPCKNTVSAKDYFGIWMNCNASIVFSDVVQHGDFLPTFWMPQSKYNGISKKLRDEKTHSGWRRETWRLYNKTAILWQKDLPDTNGEICAQQVVRCSFNNDSKKYAVTPLMLWHSANDAPSKLMYTELASVMQKTGVSELKPIIEILESKQYYMIDTKLRLTMAICAILTFCRFIEDGSNGEHDFLNEFDSDIEKISEYFGRPEALAPAFRTLLGQGTATLRAELWKILSDSIKTHAKPLCQDNQSDSENSKDLYLERASSHQIQLNNARQRIAQYRRDHKIWYGTLSHYYEPEGFFENYLTDFPTDYTSLDKKIGPLVMLQMWDTIELKAHRHHEGGRGDGRSAIYLRDV